MEQVSPKHHHRNYEYSPMYTLYLIYQNAFLNISSYTIYVYAHIVLLYILSVFIYLQSSKQGNATAKSAPFEYSTAKHPHKKTRGKIKYFVNTTSKQVSYHIVCTDVAHVHIYLFI